MIKMDYITWLEVRDWQPLRKGDLVEYDGAQWIVACHVGGTRYTLRAVGNRWHRLNAARSEIAMVGTPVD